MCVSVYTSYAAKTLISPSLSLVSSRASGKVPPVWNDTFQGCSVLRTPRLWQDPVG